MRIFGIISISLFAFEIHYRKDAEFFLYEDAGDGYGYESGEYTVTRIGWNEAKGTLLTDKL